MNKRKPKVIKPVGTWHSETLKKIAETNDILKRANAISAQNSIRLEKLIQADLKRLLNKINPKLEVAEPAPDQINSCESCKNCAQRKVCPIITASEKFKTGNCRVILDPNPMWNKFQSIGEPVKPVLTRFISNNSN